MSVTDACFFGPDITRRSKAQIPPQCQSVLVQSTTNLQAWNSSWRGHPTSSHRVLTKATASCGELSMHTRSSSQAQQCRGTRICEPSPCIACYRRTSLGAAALETLVASAMAPSPLVRRWGLEIAPGRPPLALLFGSLFALLVDSFDWFILI